MPKWISIDEAAHKYGVKEEDICLWAEMEAITASFTETTLIIDEKSLQKFLCWHETLPIKDYIHTLEQLCNNQSEVCKVYLEVIELQEQDLQYKKRRISVLEKQYAMATEQNKLREKIITITSDTLNKAESGWWEKLWMKIKATRSSQNIRQSEHKRRNK